VELADRQRGAEDGAGAGRRQCRGRQAGRGHAADGAGAGRSAKKPACPRA
jgi:hypothetical protein